MLCSCHVLHLHLHLHLQELLLLHPYTACPFTWA
jgi:hypothetical protein